MINPDDDVDMRGEAAGANEPPVVSYGPAERSRLISEAHVIHLGRPGIDCLAGFAPENVTLAASADGYVFCPACGNELGRTDQLMLQVLDWEPVGGRRTCGTAHLAFFG